MCQTISKRHWSFLGRGSEEKWYAALAYQPDGSWNRVSEQMMMIMLAESGHLALGGTSALFQGAPKRKRGGRTSIHHNAESATAELLLRIVVSVNQVSVHGGMADWCQDLAQQIAARSPSSTENPVANLDNDKASQVPSAGRIESHQITNVQCWGPRKIGAATRRGVRKPSGIN